MKKNKLVITAAILLMSVFFIRCSDDDNGTDAEQMGEISLKVTDAPSDDADVEGTFITIADVKIDCESVEGFSKQTIEISAFQNGEAKLLLNKEVVAKSYNSVTVVLDNESDASGEIPGCYVLTSDNNKHNLAGSSAQTEITFSKSFTVESNAESSLVIDFNLRKLVVRDTESENSDYKFATSAEIENAIRIVEEENSGEISGKVNLMFNTNNDIYVYAYHKGEYEASTETSGQGSSNILFTNAVTCAKVEADGSYTLSFLNEGEYEIHVAAYSNTNGKAMFKAMTDASSAIEEMLLSSITVSSQSNTKLNMNIAGLLQ